jgi:hypothetical protein
MRAERMWKTGTGKGVKDAVIDSGVNADTPVLKGQVLIDEVPRPSVVAPPTATQATERPWPS